MTIQLEGLDKAARAINANTSPRYKRLEALECWAEGTQYDGRPDWWTGGEKEVPLWERKPPIVYPTVSVAIQSNVDLVFGEARFPGFTSRPSEDEGSEENGLNQADSEALDRFIREYHKLCRFQAHCRDAFGAAQGCGTGVALHGHRNGVPFAELIPAKWGTPKFGPDQAVSALEIRYPYLDERRNPVTRKWEVAAKIYRRVIDQTRDVTFLPADADEDGVEPNWQVDPARDITHNLGFCPVVWYPFMRGCAPVNVIDGRAIHALLLDEIQGHDIALSQKHRCTLLSEPQPYETGVDPGYNPTGSGRTAIVPATEFGGYPGVDKTGEARGSYVMGSSQPARKKGPGWVWSYPDKDTKVGYLEFPAAILKSMEEHCLDLLNKIEDGMSVVLPKPANFKFAGQVSGKAIQLLRKRQYDRCDQYRDDLWNNFLRPSIEMQLRIAMRVGSQLRVPGVDKVTKALSAQTKKSEALHDDAATAAA